MTIKDASLVPITNLAYYGDSVIEKLVRKRIVENDTSEIPSKRALKFVTAPNQSKALENILDLLTEQETDIFKRGRNCVHGNVPKRATMAEYRRATGFECLFGFLDLSEQYDRMNELFDIAYPVDFELNEDKK